MPSLLSERKPFLLLLVLLTLNLVLMSSRVRGGQRGSMLEEAILTLTAPVLKAASWVSQATAGTWTSYVDLRGVRKENALLREEVQRLSLQAHEMEEARQEVMRLRELLDLRASVAGTSVAAHVIAWDATAGAGIVLLDRGSRVGLERNDPVLTTRGVVGRVILSEPGVSKVQTLLDANSGVAAMIQRTRVQGVVVGEGAAGCRMDYVSESADAEVGDVVITSGLDRIYPKGYTIGVVRAIEVGEGLTKVVQIRPEVDFRRLEEVLVMRTPGDNPSSRRESP
jgi:rod shape-determining protein MreC